MDARTYEIRDEGTHIPALAIRLRPQTARDHALLARAGYGLAPTEQSKYVILICLADMRAQHDPFEWPNRTMHVAHLHIREAWPPNGAVVDVQYILGETEQPKESEAI